MVSNLDAFIQKRARINVLQDRLRSEMTLRIECKRIPDIRNRLLAPDCAQRILQGLARPNVHVDISGSNQRHAGLLRNDQQRL